MRTGLGDAALVEHHDPVGAGGTYASLWDAFTGDATLAA